MVSRTGGEYSVKTQLVIKLAYNTFKKQKFLSAIEQKYSIREENNKSGSHFMRYNSNKLFSEISKLFLQELILICLGTYIL